MAIHWNEYRHPLRGMSRTTRFLSKPRANNMVSSSIRSRWKWIMPAQPRCARKPHDDRWRRIQDLPPPALLLDLPIARLSLRNVSRLVQLSKRAMIPVPVGSQQNTQTLAAEEQRQE